MKTIIFITLKILEVLALAISILAIIIIMAIIDSHTGIITQFSAWLRRIDNIEKINLIVFCVSAPLGAIWWFPLWIKSNKKLTSKIYKRLKNDKPNR